MGNAAAPRVAFIAYSIQTFIYLFIFYCHYNKWLRLLNYERRNAFNLKLKLNYQYLFEAEF